MKIDAELFDLCKDFIKENQITCEETIYQRDMEENALELIAQICDLIGYYEEDEEDLDFDEE